MSGDDIALYTLCEEFRAKKVGDKCSAATDCTPVPASKSDGGVANAYLTCDKDAGVCVNGDAPVIPDYLGDCSLGTIAVAPGESELRSSASCSGGWCLAVGFPGCVAQGCTIACYGDDQCPRGSVCAPTGTEDEPPNGVCVPAAADDWNCVPRSDAGADG